MKRYEKESLLKNFLVFFPLLALLLILLFIELYSSKTREYKQNLFKTMHICNYTMVCSEFSYDFVAQDQTKLNELYEGNGLYSYYTIPKSEKYYMKISYSQDAYEEDIEDIKHNLGIKFIFSMILLFMIALFFTFYSLRPIRKSLQLNDEFITDILHDFNTPITSMVLNIKMIQEDKGEDPFIKRISQGLNSMMQLQNNLKCFLQHSPTQNTQLNIGDISKKSLEMMQNTYPKLRFIHEEINTLSVFSNAEILVRIFDNILSNACKYNKPNGEVKVYIKGSLVSIIDTGKGIQNVNKVMQRYYKEQERGLGLGLHIVQKLIDELNIIIHIESKIGRGTTFTLDFKHIKKG
ncbi:MAG: HAMP domain-containing sensor histidine kinase [Sulfurovum sp.]|nr:HAMP domain-containing sensor histidine kinase [Sulfurovum sp.]